MAAAAAALELQQTVPLFHGFNADGSDKLAKQGLAPLDWVTRISDLATTLAWTDAQKTQRAHQYCRGEAATWIRDQHYLLPGTAAKLNFKTVWRDFFVPFSKRYFKTTNVRDLGVAWSTMSQNNIESPWGFARRVASTLAEFAAMVKLVENTNANAAATFNTDETRADWAALDPEVRQRFEDSARTQRVQSAHNAIDVAFQQVFRKVLCTGLKVQRFKELAKKLERRDLSIIDTLDEFQEACKEGLDKNVVTRIAEQEAKEDSSDDDCEIKELTIALAKAKGAKSKNNKKKQDGKKQKQPQAQARQVNTVPTTTPATTTQKTNTYVRSSEQCQFCNKMGHGAAVCRAKERKEMSELVSFLKHSAQQQGFRGSTNMMQGGTRAEGRPYVPEISWIPGNE